jgi:hypothetical protein
MSATGPKRTSAFPVSRVDASEDLDPLRRCLTSASACLADVFSHPVDVLSLTVGLCGRRGTSHWMPKQSTNSRKPDRRRTSIRMAIKKRLHAIRAFRDYFAFRTNAWATFFWCDNRLKIQSRSGKAEPPGRGRRT